MGLETPVRGAVHACGGKGAVHAQLCLAGLDIVGDLLQVIKALDIVLGIASSSQQFLIVDDAVGLDDVGDAVDRIALLQCKGVAGQPHRTGGSLPGRSSSLSSWPDPPGR